MRERDVGDNWSEQTTVSVREGGRKAMELFHRGGHTLLANYGILCKEERFI